MFWCKYIRFLLRSDSKTQSLQSQLICRGRHKLAAFYLIPTKSNLANVSSRGAIDFALLGLIKKNSLYCFTTGKRATL